MLDLHLQRNNYILYIQRNIYILYIYTYIYKYIYIIHTHTHICVCVCNEVLKSSQSNQELIDLFSLKKTGNFKAAFSLLR